MWKLFHFDFRELNFHHQFELKEAEDALLDKLERIEREGYMPMQITRVGIVKWDIFARKVLGA